MAYSDITCKLEAALKVVADSVGLSGVTVNTGVEEEGLALPYIICAADGSQEEILGTGIFRCTGRVTVASSADDSTLASHRANVSAVFDAFMDSDIAATLSTAVDDFYVYKVMPGAMPSTTENRQLKNSLEMEIVCCASDIG
jgi:hypothetical protein